MTGMGESLPESAADASANSALDDSQRKLLDYIKALPDGVELIDNNLKVEYKNSEDENNNHKVPVNDIHNLIVSAVKSDPLDTNFSNELIKIQQLLPEISEKICNLSNQLSFKNDITEGQNDQTYGHLEVMVEVSASVIELLQGVAHDEEYKAQQGEKYIEMKIFSYKIDPSRVNQLSAAPSNCEFFPFRCKVTDVQVLLALVVTLKCYPDKWQRLFFWDAWLAITIQLGLLKKVECTNSYNEVFPCLWMKQVFQAERLVGRPEKVYCLIMGQDPLNDVENEGDTILDELRSASGIAFHKNRAAIEGMTTQYGLDCTGDWPEIYCKQGLLLVNMIRCIPRYSKSMAGNPYYDAWFVYTLKISEYLGRELPVLVMCNRDFDANLVKNILNSNPEAAKVQHPALKGDEIPDEKDTEKFYEIVYKFNSASRMLFNTLFDYIYALPDNVKLDDNRATAEIPSRNGLIQKVPVNMLHNLIYDVGKCDSTTSCDRFIQDILRTMENKPCEELMNHLTRVKIFNKCLSFNNGNIVLHVKTTNSLIEILKKAAHCHYNQMQITEHEVEISGIPEHESDLQLRFTVNDVHVIMSLVIISKCYPEDWQKLFFWDAWLAVTIQLSLLEITNQFFDNEVFPCLWLQQVFYAEQLVKRPDRVHCLIMGQDPVSRYKVDSVLRGSTGLAFHNTNERPSIKSIIEMGSIYGLNCTGDRPVGYCKEGKLLVNMIRCIPRNYNSMTGNPYYDAWFVYSLKLAKYFGENNKPVVVICNRNYSPSLMKCILQVNPQAERVQHPGYDVKQVDKETFQQLIFYDPNLPQFWKILHDCIYKSIKHNDDSSTLIIDTGDDKHEAPVNVLHNIMFKAVRRDLSHIGANFLKTLTYNTDKVPDRPTKLTEYRISDSVTVRVSDTLIKLLNNVAQKRSYTPQNGGAITIYISSNQEPDQTKSLMLLISKHY